MVARLGDVKAVGMWIWNHGERWHIRLDPALWQSIHDVTLASDSFLILLSHPNFLHLAIVWNECTPLHKEFGFLWSVWILEVVALSTCCFVSITYVWFPSRDFLQPGSSHFRSSTGFSSLLAWSLAHSVVSLHKHACIWTAFGRHLGSPFMHTVGIEKIFVASFPLYILFFPSSPFFSLIRAFLWGPGASLSCIYAALFPRHTLSQCLSAQNPSAASRIRSWQCSVSAPSVIAYGFRTDE